MERFRTAWHGLQQTVPVAERLMLRFPADPEQMMDFDVWYGTDNGLTRRALCRHAVRTRLNMTKDVLIRRDWFLANVKRLWCFESVGVRLQTCWYFEDAAEAALFRLFHGEEEV